MSFTPAIPPMPNARIAKTRMRQSDHSRNDWRLRLESYPSSNRPNAIEIFETRPLCPNTQVARQHGQERRNVDAQRENQRRPLHAELLGEESTTVFDKPLVCPPRKGAGRRRTGSQPHVDIGKKALRRVGCDADSRPRASEDS